MRTILTIILAVMTYISACAYKYTYSFNNTPISEAIVRISKDHPDVNIAFIYKELGNVMNAFRLTLVGECKGPHIFDITELLGLEETVRRIERGTANIQLPSAQ